MSERQQQPESMASKGGKAAAAKMTRQQRSDRGKKGAEARWAKSGNQSAVLTAICGSSDRPLRIGGVEIPCYVLEDGRRVITNQGIQIGLKMAKSGGQQRTADLVASLERKGLDCKGLLSSINKPIQFRPGGGVSAYGYEATVLADLCDVVLEARERGLIHRQQEGIAAQCEVLVRAFARVGIIALIDEATGYQYARTRDELQRLLEQYISKELARWQPTFNPDFYKHLFRLKDWRYDPSSSRRPCHAARLTVDLVYNRIHPDILKELKQARAEWEQGKGKGKQGGKLHQFLTTDQGHPRLKQHLEGVIVAMKLSKTWAEFAERMDMLYPTLNQTMRLPFIDEGEDDADPISSEG